MACAGLALAAACSGTPAYRPSGAEGCTGGPVETRIGGAAGMGISDDGPVTDLDLSVTALVRPGRTWSDCAPDAEGAPRVRF